MWASRHNRNRLLDAFSPFPMPNRAGRKIVRPGFFIERYLPGATGSCRKIFPAGNAPPSIRDRRCARTATATTLLSHAVSRQLPAIRLALKLPRGQVCPGKHLPVLSLQHDFLALAYRSQPSGEHQTIASIDVERLRCPGAGLLDSQNHTFPPYAPGPGVICAVP